MRPYILMACLLLKTAVLASSDNPLDAVNQWFILTDYTVEAQTVTPAQIERYQMAILSPAAHPTLTQVDDTLLIGAMTLGAADSRQQYWAAIEGADWVLHESRSWPGHYRVDVSSSEWRALVLTQTIPDLIKQGFQGVCLQALDAPEELADEPAASSAAAIVSLVRDIHEAFPDLLLLSRDGYAILDRIAPYLSGIVVDGLCSTFDSLRNQFALVSDAVRTYRLSVLEPLMGQFNLPVFSVERVAEGDQAQSLRCDKLDRGLGIRPYIAGERLDRIYQRPGEL